MKYFRFLLPALCLLNLCFFSCAKPEKQESLKLELEEPLHENELAIYVLFGNGFNDDVFVEAVKNMLSTQFASLAKKETPPSLPPFIRPLVFPADFGGRTGRISLLADIAAEEQTGALLMIGAPEGTHRPLAAMLENNRSFPVISLFPQDDLLGQSAGADAVIEFAFSGDGMAEDQGQHIDTNSLAALIPPFVDFLRKGEKPNKPGELLKKQIENILGNSWSIHFYTDTETGLRSANCFVIEPKIKTQPLNASGS